MGIDLKAECRRLEREMARAGGDDFGNRRVDCRAYEIQPGSPLAGQRIRDLEQLARDARLFVERMRREDRIIDPALYIFQVKFDL